jgi:uncharacterized protein
MMRHYPYSWLSIAVLLAATTLTGVTAFAQSSTKVAKLPIAELQKLADAGDPAAQNELGVRYSLGRDVEKDPAKAIPWYLKAARRGFAKAYFNLGAAYYNGDGVAISDKDSCVWFTLAADAGDPAGQEAVDRVRQDKLADVVECQTLTASVYLSSNVIKQNYGLAAKWFTVAANAGDRTACERLAYLYARGLGVPKDKRESLKWLKRSAHLGYPIAMFELARAYDLGDLAPQNIPLACNLYRQAARAGHSDAMLALAEHYSTGKGVPADTRKAYMYYYMASMFGRTEAKSRIDELAAQLPAKQVAAAQKDAVEFVQHGGSPLLVVHK